MTLDPVIGLPATLIVLVAGALLTLLVRPRAASRMAFSASFLSALPLIWTLVMAFQHNTETVLTWAWMRDLFGVTATFGVCLDPLRMVFLAPAALVFPVAAYYGIDYLASQPETRRLNSHWASYLLLQASVILTVTAASPLVFLIAWEIMSLTAYFLIIFEDRRTECRVAGWMYLVVSQLSAACLLAMFFLIGPDSLGTWNFSLPAGHAVYWVVCALALAGFGLKAGMVPFHVWLPEAHPAAPSHVSAVLSGVVIKTGIFGLMLVLLRLAEPAALPLLGGIVLGCGAISAVYGILMANFQTDLKRMLAYSSVENIGLILLGFGLFLLGTGLNMPLCAQLALLGTLMHVFNHALVKSMLFLNAGAVGHAAGTREMDNLGGLLKRMPGTGAGFLIGAAALAGLPPLNIFLGEFLLYVSALSGLRVNAAPGAVAFILALLTLTLAGPLALFAFARAFGIVFLGEARTPVQVHATPPRMRRAANFLAALTLLVTPLAAGLAWPVLRNIPLFQSADIRSLAHFFGALLALCALVALMALLRKKLLARRTPEEAGTWDCGYAAPTARMQYTAVSLSQPLATSIQGMLRFKQKLSGLHGMFPVSARRIFTAPDFFLESAWRRLFNGVAGLIGPLRRIQHGHIHGYILYIALTLLGLLVWNFGVWP